MHGLDLDDLDSIWKGSDDPTPDSNPLQDDIRESNESLKALQLEHEAKMAEILEPGSGLNLEDSYDDLDAMRLKDEQMLLDGDEDSESLDEDWNFDNNYFEGADGLEEFEADLSDLDELEDGEDPLLKDISDWDWEDEEEESEHENEREEAGGWGNNKGLEEHQQAIIIILAVSATILICGFAGYYLFCSGKEEVDESGRKLTRK